MTSSPLAPRVDVIIPCYNYGAYLAACVGSVLEQPVPTRVLIIDDASTDATPAIGTALAAQHPQIEYRRHAINLGHIRTYNEGLAWLESDYCILLSADDLLVPGVLGEIVAFLDQHPAIGLLYGTAIQFSTSAPTVTTPPAAYRFTPVGGHDFIADVCRNGVNPVASPAAAVARTDLQRRIGVYRSELPHSGDLDMWLRFAAYADVATTPAPVGYYRRHGANMSERYKDLEALRQHRLMFDLWFTEHGARFPDGERLAAQARETLATRAFWEASRRFDSGDHAPLTDYLGFVLALAPSFANTRPWRRLRYKQLLGVRGWRVVRPWVEALRRVVSGREGTKIGCSWIRQPSSHG